MLGKIVWGQMRLRPLLSGLHIVLIAIGTSALLLVSQLLHGVQEGAARDAQGIDLVIGAKGSPVQLVMAGVYHIDVPSGNIPLSALKPWADHPLVESVIPLALGDSFGRFRIVGTTPGLLAHYRARFASGQVWSSAMDVVLGADVAETTQLQIGETVAASHGVGGEGAAHADHALMVVGTLKPTGTIADRLIFTSLQSVWHAHSLPIDANASNDVTIALVKYKSPLAASMLARQINATSNLQAASPALESARLLTIFGWVADVLRAFAWLVVAVAGASLFAAMSQIVASRQFDIAVSRALGASRATIVKLLIAETALIALIGVSLAFLLVRVAAVVANRWLPSQVHLPLSPPTTQQGMIAMVVFGFALACSLWPAWRAYRVNAGEVLSRGR